MSHLRPLLGGVDSSSPSNSNTSNGDADSSRQSVSGKRRREGPVGGASGWGQWAGGVSLAPLAQRRAIKQLSCQLTPGMTE